MDLRCSPATAGGPIGDVNEHIGTGPVGGDESVAFVHFEIADGPKPRCCHRRRDVLLSKSGSHLAGNGQRSVDRCPADLKSLCDLRRSQAFRLQLATAGVYKGRPASIEVDQVRVGRSPVTPGNGAAPPISSGRNFYQVFNNSREGIRRDPL
jgi:hypothetical protein